MADEAANKQRKERAASIFIYMASHGSLTINLKRRVMTNFLLVFGARRVVRLVALQRTGRSMENGRFHALCSVLRITFRPLGLAIPGDANGERGPVTAKTGLIPSIRRVCQTVIQVIDISRIGLEFDCSHHRRLGRGDNVAPSQSARSNDGARCKEGFAARSCVKRSIHENHNSHKHSQGPYLFSC